MGCAEPGPTPGFSKPTHFEGAVILRAMTNSPVWPFLLVFILPIITALAGFAIITGLPDCGVDEPWWEAGHIRLAFLPGLLNLLPLVWLPSSIRLVRQAAIVSGFMGAAQFALPQAAFAAYAAGPGATGQLANGSCAISSFMLPWLALAMLILWLMGVITGAMMVRRKPG